MSFLNLFILKRFSGKSTEKKNSNVENGSMTT